MWLDRQGGRAVELFYFPFLCGFQTQSRTPLSQLKLSISQRLKGESWLLEKAAQGRGWNDWSMARYFLSHSFSVGIVVTDSSNFFFSNTAISPSDAWARQQRGGEALFPSDACEGYPGLPKVNLPSKIFPDEVKIKNTVA